MATLSRSEEITRRAKAHARRTWTCPLCGMECRGNGGKSSHKAMHLKGAGLPPGDWVHLIGSDDRGVIEYRASCREAT